MRFTVAPPGAPLPPQAPAAPKLPRLGKIWKDRAADGAYRVVKAVTADGEWLFALLDGQWHVGHLPTKTEVRGGFKTLAACRRYAASGKARADLDRIQSGKTAGN